MPDSRTLHILRCELLFLNSGGYGHSFRSHWRPTLIFRDSPICLNFDSGAPFQPCERCALFPLIPEAKRNCHSPCHHIPLSEHGDTVASLYQYGTQEQLDAMVSTWLETTIKKCEREEKCNAGS